MRVAGEHSPRPQTAAEVREPDGHGAKPAAVREKAILALLSEKSIGRAAIRSGVNEKTLRRWLMEDAQFQAVYAAARQVAFQAGMSRLQALAGRAVDALEELLGDKKHPSVRLGAARTVAELASQRHDAETLLSRIQELEEVANNGPARA